MSICFPYMLLESVIPNLSGESWMSSQSTTTTETRSMLESELEDLTLPLSVLIGQTKLTIRDLLQLQQNDVLVLEKPVESDLIVQVGGKTKMGGKSGMVGRKKAVKVTRIIEEEVPGSNE
jgi:flagellar motor switch protein FliM